MTLLFYMSAKPEASPFRFLKSLKFKGYIRMFKKINSKLSIFLSTFLGMVLILSFPLSANAQTFTDVNSKTKFNEEIQYLVDHGITNGWTMKDGSKEYRPQANVSREVLMAFLYRAMGSPDYTPPKTSPFVDVSTKNVFYKEITWAHSQGIIKGYKTKGGYKASPGKAVKRSEIAAFLQRSSGDKAPKAKQSFEDVKPTQTHAAAITWMKDKGISKGTKKSGYKLPFFSPNDYITRDSMAVFMKRWMEYSGYQGTPVVPENFTVNGSGFGHGVGMSQYGAEQMARNGKTAEQILEHYYNPAQLSYSSSYANSNIRVQLIVSSYQKITPVGGSMTLSVGSKKYTTSKAVDMKLVNGVREYTINGSKVRTTSSFDTLTWTDRVKVDRANASSKAVTYKYGSMRLTTIGSQINVSNILKVNTEYLYGLAEMPASWSQSSLQAQAVAGRTYAMRNMSSIKASCDCNVYDEVKSQKFTGYDVISGYKGDNWKKAVDATVRKSGSNVSSAAVMKYNGALIDAVYSSSSAGGKTQSGKDMWGGNTAYLQSRNDPYSTTSLNPNSSWTVNASQSKMNSVFGLKNIVEITVKKNSSGYAQTVTAVDKDGKSKTISGAQFRNALGLKSTGVSSITS